MKTTLLIVLALALAVPLAAQQPAEGDFDPKKVIKEIQKDLDTILEDLATLSGIKKPEAGQRVSENIDKLIDQMQGNQSGLVKKIEELIKNQKLQQSQNQSQNQQQQQQQQRNRQQQQQQQNRRNRNRPETPQERRERERREREQQQNRKPQDGNPDSTEESRENPDKNEQTGRKPQDPPPEKNPGDPRHGAWGFLPPEMRQALIERNFRDFFPNYEREISDYLKSLNRKR